MTSIRFVRFSRFKFFIRALIVVFVFWYFDDHVFVFHISALAMSLSHNI